MAVGLLLFCMNPLELLAYMLELKFVYIFMIS